MNYNLIGLNMQRNLVMGFLDNSPDSIQSFGFKNTTVICSGVLLINLKGLRQYEYSKKIADFISKYQDRLIQHDQTIINVVFQNRIALLPPRYGTWDFDKRMTAKGYLKIKRSGLKYNKKDLYYAIEHPLIMHFVGRKPFLDKNSIFNKEWWYFAKISGFYLQIYSKYFFHKEKIQKS